MTRLEPPVVCLVTDSKRLLDGLHGFDDPCAALVDLAREASAGGVGLIQVREHSLEAEPLRRLVSAIVEAIRGAATRVVVNDRLDVALASGAHGVHLRGDSIPPSAARAIVPPGFLVGRSVHSVEEAREHAPAVDYLIAGTVFPTPSKSGSHPLLRPSGLRQIVAAVDVPVIAIGGITVDRISEVAATGAAGIAGIGLYLPGGVPVSRVVDVARAQFDSSKTAS